MRNLQKKKSINSVMCYGSVRKDGDEKENIGFGN